MRLLYHLWYRFATPPWVGGPRGELVDLVEAGRIPPGRAIDLGCGVGDNVIFLARRGFEAVGVDFAASAIERARTRAAVAGVGARFIVDDLTSLQHVAGPFDLLVDYGTLDDLSRRGRSAYLRNVVPLTRPGTQFLLWCFEWKLRWWERVLTRMLPFGDLALAPGEVDRRFGPWFSIERIAGASDTDGWPRGYAAYLMERNGRSFGGDGSTNR